MTVTARLTERKADSKSTRTLRHNQLHRLPQQQLGPLLSFSSKPSIESKNKLSIQRDHQLLKNAMHVALYLDGWLCICDISVMSSQTLNLLELTK